MLKKRIIPCMDMRDGRVVKGVHFLDIRDAGDPVEAARQYGAHGADELMLLDINASHEGRKTMYEVVERVAEQVFIPFTVGGGISDLKVIKNVLRRGADKVSINTSAVKTPDLINRAADRFGSQCIVVSVDVKRRADKSGWDVYIYGGRENTGLDALQWIQEMQDRGAGEILLTSMDADGSMQGFDVALLREASRIARVPLIASGGAGKLEHFYDAAQAGADALLAASLFHFGHMQIGELKAYLDRRGIPVRLDGLENEQGA